MLKIDFPIRGDRLLSCIAWLAWARHHLVPGPGQREAPSYGYADRNGVKAIIERYDVSAHVWAKQDCWADVGDLLFALPPALLRRLEFSLAAILGRAVRRTAEADVHLTGFVRLLHAVTCGELTESELLTRPVFPAETAIK